MKLKLFVVLVIFSSMSLGFVTESGVEPVDTKRQIENEVNKVKSVTMIPTTPVTPTTTTPTVTPTPTQTPEGQ